MINLLKLFRLFIELFGTLLITVGEIFLTVGIMGLGYYGLKTGVLPNWPFQLLIASIIISKKLIFPGLRKIVGWLLYKLDCAIEKNTKISHPRYFL